MEVSFTFKPRASPGKKEGSPLLPLEMSFVTMIATREEDELTLCPNPMRKEDVRSKSTRVEDDESRNPKSMSEDKDVSINHQLSLRLISLSIKKPRTISGSPNNFAGSRPKQSGSTTNPPTISGSPNNFAGSRPKQSGSTTNFDGSGMKPATNSLNQAEITAVASTWRNNPPTNTMSCNNRFISFSETIETCVEKRTFGNYQCNGTPFEIQSAASLVSQLFNFDVTFENVLSHHYLRQLNGTDGLNQNNMIVSSVPIQGGDNVPSKYSTPSFNKRKRAFETMKQVQIKKKCFGFKGSSSQSSNMKKLQFEMEILEGTRGFKVNQFGNADSESLEQQIQSCKHSFLDANNNLRKHGVIFHENARYRLRQWTSGSVKVKSSPVLTVSRYDTHYSHFTRLQ